MASQFFPEDVERALDKADGTIGVTTALAVGLMVALAAIPTAHNWSRHSGHHAEHGRD